MIVQYVECLNSECGDVSLNVVACKWFGMQGIMDELNSKYNNTENF